MQSIPVWNLIWILFKFEFFELSNKLPNSAIIIVGYGYGE